MNILITGAAQGIGAATAKSLTSLENTLILVDLQADKLSDFANELRPACREIIEFAGDLGDPVFLEKLTTYISDGSIEVIVNNAAIAPKLDRFENLSANKLDIAYKINIRAPFEIIQSAIPFMRQNSKGMILNFASRANIYGYATMGIYAATKAAITSFSGTVALENPEIKSITIIPGRTNTEMQASLRGIEESANSQSPEYVASIVTEVIKGNIEVNSGDSVIIDFGKYKVVSELDKSDLHKNMH